MKTLIDNRWIALAGYFIFLLMLLLFIRPGEIGEYLELLILPVLLDAVLTFYRVASRKQKGVHSIRQWLDSQVFFIAMMVMIGGLMFFEPRPMGGALLLLLITRFAEHRYTGVKPLLDVVTNRMGVKRELGKTGRFILSFIAHVLSVLSFIYASIVLLIFGGYPNIWLLLLVPTLWILIAATTRRRFSISFNVMRVSYILFFMFFTYVFLNNTKALWPSHNESVLGLSERPFNKISTGTWDTAEEWYRFEASPEEVAQIVNRYTVTQTVDGQRKTIPALVKDSALAKPGRGYLSYIRPFRWKKPRCEHWKIHDSLVWNPSLPVSIYYHPESRVVEVFEVTEY